VKIINWTADVAKKELAKRLSYGLEVRARLERDWIEAENTLFSTRAYGTPGDLNITFDSYALDGTSQIDQSNSDYSVNYAYKNWRYICSQLAANPPAVIARPNTSDLADRRKADAGDRVSRYLRTQLKLQEIIEQGINNSQAYGTCITKTIWDTTLGDPIDYDESSGTMTLTGDFHVVNISPWNFVLDPDSETWEEVKWCFERVMMPYEEACYRFPDNKELLQKARVRQSQDDGAENTSFLKKSYYDAVEVYQYWEKGLPHNGYIGRMCWCTKEGEVLGSISANPFRFSPPRDRGLDLPEGQDEAKKELLAKAYLPYHVFTDSDIPGYVWGKASVLYATPLQDLHNRLYNTIINCVQAHGVARLILPEGADISEESITNSPWDVVRITGSGQDPRFMEPMPLPAAVSDLVALTRQGIDDMCGVNESMFGQQSREQSGFSMQYATSQGNMIRQRVFNKYRLYVESLYKALLNLARKHWTESRTIHVLGKEKAFEAIDLKGADIDGGFDLVLEYGNSLSIDPSARREEIITLLPLFEKAGVDTRTILGLMKLNELEGAYDRVTMAGDRQREIFEEMIAKNIYIEPRGLQDHKNMLAWAYDYIMSAEFKYLDESHKQLIERHIGDREQKAASTPAVAPEGAADVAMGQPAGPQGPMGPLGGPAQ
jgi:hypothetical protein